MHSHPVPQLCEAARTQVGSVRAFSVKETAQPIPDPGKDRAQLLAPRASLYVEGPHAPPKLTPLQLLICGCVVAGLVVFGIEVLR